ncbi:hypothetical protein CYMTET_24471 [Cymbomonas tetramitiformis]|uniref:Uncharacterized protein n=1 Tax=Cymbomonas tetramitiformis TaxID=36881 RepID=A0AAE0FVS3_9CHLO|nr:hypothetical protein CYMTET_24471 [Cymbomonas tetramitiformis]
MAAVWSTHPISSRSGSIRAKALPLNWPPRQLSSANSNSPLRRHGQKPKVRGVLIRRADVQPVFTSAALTTVEDSSHRFTRVHAQALALLQVGVLAAGLLGTPQAAFASHHSHHSRHSHHASHAHHSSSGHHSSQVAGSSHLGHTSSSTHTSHASTSVNGRSGGRVGGRSFFRRRAPVTTQRATRASSTRASHIAESHEAPRGPYISARAHTHNYNVVVAPPIASSPVYISPSPTIGYGINLGVDGRVGRDALTDQEGVLCKEGEEESATCREILMVEEDNARKTAEIAELKRKLQAVEVGNEHLDSNELRMSSTSASSSQSQAPRVGKP